MMNLTRNDWQCGQGGARQWAFRYRLVLTESYDPLQAIREAQRFGVPPHLQVPGEEPAVAGLRAIDVGFDGGPVTALKVAEDGSRLVLRLWNVLDRPASGTARLPEGFGKAERCDGLERRLQDLPVKGGQVRFTVRPRGVLTVAFCRG